MHLLFERRSQRSQRSFDLSFYEVDMYLACESYTEWNIQWNPDFSNLQGKRQLVRDIGNSRNRRWHQITINRQETLVYDLRNVPGTFAQIIEVRIIGKKAECAKHADCMASSNCVGNPKQSFYLSD